MNLSDLHQRLSRKPSYRRTYDAIGDVVLIGAAVRKLREDEEITQAELVAELGISHFYLSRLETGSGKVPPEVVAAVVRRFDKLLRKIGIDVDPWLAIELPKPTPKKTPTQYGRRSSTIPDSVSRHRHVDLTRKPQPVIREKPSQKYGKDH